jgi:ParB family chromosome partitioning protein
MSKTDDLRRRLEAKVADSVGLRGGEEAVAETAAVASPPPAIDYVLDRSVGAIAIDEVIPDPDQPRREYDAAELAQLAADLKERGQLAPIRVRWNKDHGKWMIISGERRWRAARQAGLPTITCVFIDRELSETEIRSEQLVENLLREDLTPMEEARGYQALMAVNGWKASDVADRLHRSRGAVSKALALLKLPDDVQQQVDEGTLPPSTAYQIAKVKDAAKQRELAAEASAGRIGYVETEKKSRARGTGQGRRSTNETFRTAEGAKVAVTCRKALGEAGIVNALLEAVEAVRKRPKQAA